MADSDKPAAPADSDVELSRAAARDAELALPPALAATSVGDYLRTSLARVKGGESGILPVVGGLL
ncbi:MAG: hypothetical protein QOJ31_869, partial [Gaiellales bacterium]|nr:hypothetical protein [Gaiellales bacterium]